jgi:sec-independent protein translocase protein TatC
VDSSPPAQYPVLPSAKKADDEGGAATMSITEHLTELRKRLIRCIVAVLVGFLACYHFSERIFVWIAAPLRDALPPESTMMFTRVAEGFLVDMKVAFVAGIAAASPYIFFQIWSFVAPGLYKEERRRIMPLSLGSVLLFIAGASFCYFAAFPAAFNFFMSFARSGTRAAITLDNYFDFSLHMVLAFGIMFQMPIVSYFLTNMGVIGPERLRSWRRYAVVGNFILAALLTPPDIFSQLFMALPLLLLYEISILVSGLAAGR